MTNRNPYTTFAPEIQALVEAGEIDEGYARRNHGLALLLVGFMYELANRPEIQAMFEANDKEHFVEGLQHSQTLTRELGNYLANYRAA